MFLKEWKGNVSAYVAQRRVVVVVVDAWSWSVS